MKSIRKFIFNIPINVQLGRGHSNAPNISNVLEDKTQELSIGSGDDRSKKADEMNNLGIKPLAIGNNGGSGDEDGDEEKNKEAENLYSMGMKAWELKDYKLAKEKFTEAYYQCTSGYVNAQKFMNEIKHAEADEMNNLDIKPLAIGNNGGSSDEEKNKAAENLYSMGMKAWELKDYKLAKEKFTEAYYQCTSGYVNAQKFMDEIKHAEAYEMNNLDIKPLAIGNKDKSSDEGKNNVAEDLNSMAIKAWNLEDYKLAKEKFTEAYYQCTSGYVNAQKFKDKIKHAEAAIYNCEGNELHKNGKCEEAVKKYEKALEVCPSHEIASINIYKSNMAGCFQCLGNQCFDQKKYEESKDFFKKYHQKYIECYESDKSYESKMKNAEAAMYNCEGRCFLIQAKYEEAMKKFLQALETCPSAENENVQTYKNNMALCCKK